MNVKIILSAVLVTYALVLAGGVLAGEEGCSVNYVLISPPSVEGEAGSSVTIPVTVSNHGTCGAVLVVTAEVPEGWSSTTVETGKLFRGDSEVVDITVTIPEDAIPLNMTITGTMRHTSYASSTTVNFQVIPAQPKDSDGDGIPDDQDAFPDDPTEWADSDGDRVGNNADVFLYDPNETKDSDGDGVGDNADAYPNDPTRTTKEKEGPSSSLSLNVAGEEKPQGFLGGITGNFVKLFGKSTLRSVFAALFLILFAVIVVYAGYMGKIYFTKK